MAWLPVITVFTIDLDTPMLEIAPPFEQTPPLNRLPLSSTGVLWYWLSTRSAAPPRSGPDESQRLPVNRELITWNSPPRTRIAPPPPPSARSPVELPLAKVRFCTTSVGESWSW